MITHAEVVFNIDDTENGPTLVSVYENAVHPYTILLRYDDTEVLLRRLLTVLPPAFDWVLRSSLGAVRGAVMVQSAFWSPKRASGLEPQKNAPTGRLPRRGRIVRS
jgi:hypothetical protein